MSAMKDLATALGIDYSTGDPAVRIDATDLLNRLREAFATDDPPRARLLFRELDWWLTDGGDLPADWHTPDPMQRDIFGPVEDDPEPPAFAMRRRSGHADSWDVIDTRDDTVVATGPEAYARSWLNA